MFNSLIHQPEKNRWFLVCNKKVEKTRDQNRETDSAESIVKRRYIIHTYEFWSRHKGIHIHGVGDCPPSFPISPLRARATVIREMWEIYHVQTPKIKFFSHPRDKKWERECKAIERVVQHPTRIFERCVPMYVCRTFAIMSFAINICWERHLSKAVEFFIQKDEVK